MSSKTRAQLATEITTDWPNNTSGAITPALARNTLQDLVDSAPNLTDGPFTLYSGDGTLADNRTITGAGNRLIINGYSTVDIVSDPTYASQYTEFVMDTSSFSLESSDGTDVVTLVSAVGGITQYTAKTIAIIGKTGGTVTISGPSITLGNDSAKLIGVYGASPVARPASADQAVATDPASTMALANALRAALVATGWIKGAA